MSSIVTEAKHRERERERERERMLLKPSIEREREVWIEFQEKMVN
jgi:hypothetical protein